MDSSIDTMHTSTSTGFEEPSADDVLAIPVIVESVQVQRRLVDTGRGLRVHKWTGTEVVTVEEQVAADHLTVERVPIDRVVDCHPAVRQEGDTLVVPVVVERLVTRVELVLVEEVRVTRRRVSQLVQQDVTLRRDEVVVERFDEHSTAAPPGVA